MAAIQAGGVVLAALIGVAMLRREWRMPALVGGLLAIPGNVDNLMPQMTLDPHAIASNTAPAISVVDLLIAWALALTLAEALSSWPTRPVKMGPGGPSAVSGLVGLSLRLSMALAAVALGVAVIAAMRGVEIAADVRGVLVFVRILALLVLAGRLSDVFGDGTRLASAFSAAGFVLIVNGIYTGLTTGADRFTATTFGRNTLGLILVVIVVVSTGLAVGHWPDLMRRRGMWPPAALGLVAGIVCLFAAVATGTRMVLIILIVAAVLGVLAARPATLAAVVRVGALATVAAIVIGASVLFSAAGGRTVSVIGDADEALISGTPGQADASAIRTRTQFWSLAVDMAVAEPLLGVGPFQWNIVRYVRDPSSPIAVADTHDAYLQIAAEYGLVVLFLYSTLLISAGLPVIWAIARSIPTPIPWPAVGLAIAGLLPPIADITNSNLFHPRAGPIDWLLLGVGGTCALGWLSGTNRPRPAMAARTLAGTGQG
jgi:O-antigen ligase